MLKRSQLMDWNRAEIQAAIRALTDLRADMLRLELRFSQRMRELRATQRSSAANLIHYLALRGHDLRKLQKKLTDIGVCSLAVSEGQILNDVDRVLAILRRLERSAQGSPAPKSRGTRFASVLDARTEALLGPRPTGRNVRIMVTAPSEAATNYELVHKLLQHGMNCLRINCAYGALFGLVRFHAAQYVAALRLRRTTVRMESGMRV